MEEANIDLRIPDAQRGRETEKSSQLCFNINGALHSSPECRKLI